jgi:hypothetical protein
MKKTISKILITVLFTIVLSCKKNNDPKPEDPQDPNETELITAVKIILKEEISGNISVFKFVDIDGPGGEQPVMDDIVLDAGKTYHGKIILLDQTKVPVDSVSKEVYEERNDHQFFYIVHSADLAVAYTDYDSHGVPVGLLPDFTTGSPGTGTLKLILKHQPGVKPTSGLGDITRGETDVELKFNLTIN